MSCSREESHEKSPLEQTKTISPSCNSLGEEGRNTSTAAHIRILKIQTNIYKSIRGSEILPTTRNGFTNRFGWTDNSLLGGFGVNILNGGSPLMFFFDISTRTAIIESASTLIIREKLLNKLNENPPEILIFMWNRTCITMDPFYIIFDVHEIGLTVVQKIFYFLETKIHDLRIVEDDISVDICKLTNIKHDSIPI